MSIQGYDEWKTASPYDDDFDPTEEASKVLKSYRWARMNWEDGGSPGPWDHHLRAMEKVIDELIVYIVNELND